MNRSIQQGALGGVAGGLVFGLLMSTMGMFPIVARMTGSVNLLVGVALHLTISAVLGVVFGLLFASHITTVRAGVLLGLGYGAMWWVLGTLIVLPTLLGQGPQFAQALSAQNLLSLFGHLLYGAVIGGLHVPFFRLDPALNPRVA